MTQDRINEGYYDWLCDIACASSKNKRMQYSNLLRQLHNTQFDYFKPMDGNRAADGIDLRYRYGRKHGYSDPLIASVLDIRPCSVLEMMIALAVRCENQIMEDSNFGDRTSLWFWTMVRSLGLIEATDTGYNPNSVSEVLQAFMDYRYSSNGEGGLFTVQGRNDMLEMDIWYQMMAYLNSIL